jgi:hypothetical protein
MDLTRLTTLKARLLTASQFSDVFSYFMDNFGNNLEFIELGEQTRHALVEAVIGQVGKAIFGHDVNPSGLVLTRIGDEQFIHGGFLLEGCLASVFYFDDVHVGLMAVVMGNPENETKFARFSGRQLFQRPEPSLN